jgi:hypothetical protein
MAGSKTDPCAVFRKMLNVGNPPNTMAELLAVSMKLDSGGFVRRRAAAKPGKKHNR